MQTQGLFNCMIQSSKKQVFTASVICLYLGNQTLSESVAFSFALKGVVDNISFFKTKDGYQARKKTGVDGAAIAKDPRFERTRGNTKSITILNGKSSGIRISMHRNWPWPIFSRP